MGRRRSLRGRFNAPRWRGDASAHSDIESEQDITLADDASSLEGTRWVVGTAASASAVLSYFAPTHVTPSPTLLFGVCLQSGQQGRQPSPLARVPLTIFEEKASKCEVDHFISAGGNGARDDAVDRYFMLSRNFCNRPSFSVAGMRPGRKLSGDELPDSSKVAWSFRYGWQIDHRRLRVATGENDSQKTFGEPLTRSPRRRGRGSRAGG